MSRAGPSPGPEPPHSPEDLERRPDAWIRSGSSDAAERETGISAAALRAQKSRHPDKFRQLAEAYERELSDARRAIARDVVDGIREGVLVCRKLLRSDLQGAASAAQAAASVVRALTSVDRFGSEFHDVF